MPPACPEIEPAAPLRMDGSTEVDPANGRQSPPIPAGTRVLVVCQGNICRSPMAVALWRRRHPAHLVNSAGLGALIGSPIDPLAEQALAAYRLSGKPHVARQLTQSFVTAADLVLVMDHAQLGMFNAMFPLARDNAFLLGHWLGGMAIADPVRGTAQEFLAACHAIQACVESWTRWPDAHATHGDAPRTHAPRSIA
jgi:protein-tyrosine phosphatase